MSIDVELYKQAREVIEEVSYKHVNIDRAGEDLIVSVHQTFGADRTMSAQKLLGMAGFERVQLGDNTARGRKIWEHSPSMHWQVTATHTMPYRLSLVVEWKIAERQDPQAFRGGLRAMNRVFNTFREKMEESPCSHA